MEGASRMWDAMTEKILLPAALCLIENAISVSIATIAFLFFCACTRLFSSSEPDTEDEIHTSHSPTRKENEDKPLLQEPLPKWGVLRALNYLVIGLFIASITLVLFNYRTISQIDGSSNGSLFPILVIWTVCMAYFFGFFGIAFLDKASIQRSHSSLGLSQLNQGSQPNHEGYHQEPTSTSIERPGGIGSIPAGTSSRCSGVSPSRPAASSGLPSISELDIAAMGDEELVEGVLDGVIKDHQLETKLGDHSKAVRIRRKCFEARMGKSLVGLPYDGYDYARIFGANCEIVCGYIPIPVGIVGPLLVNGEEIYVPMSTTEGCLVASTNRGCKAICQGGGASAVVLKDGITRAPCLRMPDAMGAAAVKLWVETPENFARLKEAFESTTSFGKLTDIKCTCAGRCVYMRFSCFSGDAMGMNMISKGCLAAVELLEEVFPDIELVAISGNMCTDKKPAAINWIEGRGKSVVCEARIGARFVESTLKTTVKALVDTNIQKNLVGSAMAGAMGGFNAHAANIVTAIFLATGQDPAQNVESSQCITLMEECDNGDLLISVNMPCIEVGTCGGGTSLAAQGACLDIIGCRGASKSPNAPGTNAQQLAKVVASAVLAGELSLMAALASNQLVRAHMQHNRKVG